MKDQDRNKAIMFADIVGSSALYVELGNKAAKAFIADTLKTMSDIVERNDGKVIKTIGDEIMVAFNLPDNACEAAIAIGLELRRINIFVRTGISYGNVIIDNNDAFGDTVNNAAHLAKLAQARQIVVTNEALISLSPWLAQLCEPFDKIFLKGSTEQTTIHRVTWDKYEGQVLDATLVGSHLDTSHGGLGVQLTLTINGQTHTLHKNDPPLVCGRDPNYASICIANEKTSRRHCSFYYHRGKFVVEDHSTNGSYIHTSDSTQLYIRREATPLTNEGIISLGQVKSPPNQQIHFKI